MTVGIVMLVHTAFERAEQVARHWTAAGCPVVLHVDNKVGNRQFKALHDALADDPLVRFSRRHRCEWGTWGIVAATQSAAMLLLDSFADVRHVFLSSGSCLPVRPVDDLKAYLDAHPDTDFIESVTTADVAWTVGGLDHERFTLRFPFSWRKHRRAFDAYVRLQRRVRFSRRIPDGLDPHMGSQWWCLTRRTLSAILQDPRRPEYDRYFQRVWIPDESYFQTLARLFSSRIESRSLTLARFDFQGKPFIFYDDHLQLLRRTDCFVARKIWPRADVLYRTHLAEGKPVRHNEEPDPARIERTFADATRRRTRGRRGLYMQSRLPRPGWENGLSAAPYTVLQGFTDLFNGFEDWLTQATDARVHGHLFAPRRAEFFDRGPTYAGSLSNSAKLRDYSPERFLTNLVWNTRGEHQCFQFGPDDRQDIMGFLVWDENAHITILSGAWAVPLFRSNRNFADLRKEAARLQKIERQQITLLEGPQTRAKVRVMTLAEFVAAPKEPLDDLLTGIRGARDTPLRDMPKMADLTGFGQFLQNLRNQGMQPHLMGDFPLDPPPLNQPPVNQSQRPDKPYLVT